MGVRTSIRLVMLMTAGLLAAGGARDAVGAPIAQAATDLSWKNRVLAVARPLADRRLSRSEAPASPFLALGFDALGRASGDARYGAAATAAARTGDDTTEPDRDTVCAENDCSADDLLHASALWAGSGEGQADRPGVVTLDPAFRRMADVLFDREALLFHADTAPDMEGRFDAHLNARAFAALTRMIDALPPEDPARLEHVALYREMARPIVRLQGTDGWWRGSLEDRTAPIDRSSSALYVYGLTWGLNAGMLSFNEGEATALRGWNALSAPEGLAALQADDEGVGALFMAAAQMAERRW